MKQQTLCVVDSLLLWSGAQQPIVQVRKNQHAFPLKWLQRHLNYTCEHPGRKGQSKRKDVLELISSALKSKPKEPSVMWGDGNVKIRILQVSH